MLKSLCIEDGEAVLARSLAQSVPDEASISSSVTVTQRCVQELGASLLPI